MWIGKWIFVHIMLHRISYEALKKTAIYGAALSTTGSFILYYQIQSEPFAAAMASLVLT